MLRPYYLAEYRSAEGNFELYKFFIEKNLELCRRTGIVGMIVSATFLVQPTFERLRRIVSAQQLLLLAPLGPKVFKNATVDTAIFLIRKARPETAHQISVVTPKLPVDLPRTGSYPVRQQRFSTNPGFVFDYRLTEDAAGIVQRLLATYPAIERGYEFGVGINTGYIKEELTSNRRIDRRYHRMVPGTGISRYGAVETQGWIMYDAEFVKSRGERGRTLPAEHLLSSEKILIVRTRNLSLKRRVIATIDSTGAYNLNRLSNIVARPGYSLRGLLGFLNSNLFNWLFSTRFFDYEIKPVYLRSAPLADANDRHLNEMVAEMLNLHDRLVVARTGHEKTVIKRQIEVRDNELDQLVYRFYEVTSEEIAIIEDSAQF